MLRTLVLLVLASCCAKPASAVPSVRVADIIGNPARYVDMRVKLTGLVTKVEPDPLSPGGAVYMLQDSSDEVIRVRTLAAPKIDSRVYVVGTVAQDDNTSKPNLVEIAHGVPGPPVPLLLAAGAVLLAAAVVLIYFILNPRPPRTSPGIQDGPIVHRRPVITQVFHDDTVAVLVATSGPHKGDVFKVYHGTNTIGRDDNQTVQLPDDLTVSRSHARLEADNGTLVITNQSSTNPTKVGGQAVNEKEIGDGDVIQIGSTKLRVSLIPDDQTCGPDD